MQSGDSAAEGWRRVGSPVEVEVQGVTKTVSEPDEPQKRYNLPVLMYHEVARGPVSRSFRRFVVPPALFEEHCAALSGAGYQSETVSALSSPVADSDRKPKVIVTFDDGFAGFMSEALPTLVRFEMKATLFIPSAFVGGRAAWLSSIGEDQRRIIDWEDARAATAKGIEVGAHGHHHRELDVVGREHIEWELETSRNIIADALGEEVSSLAYPFGYHNRAVRDTAERVGYRVACAVGYGMHTSVDDPMQVRRFLIGPDTTGDALLRIVDAGGTSFTESFRNKTRPAWYAARRCRSMIRSSG